jgi:hypothetical protein
VCVVNCLGASMLTLAVTDAAQQTALQKQYVRYKERIPRVLGRHTAHPNRLGRTLVQKILWK